MFFNLSLFVFRHVNQKMCYLRLRRGRVAETEESIRVSSMMGEKLSLLTFLMGENLLLSPCSVNSER